MCAGKIIPAQAQARDMVHFVGKIIPVWVKTLVKHIILTAKRYYFTRVGIILPAPVKHRVC